MKITITGVPPYDGEYHIGDNVDDWTNREWSIMKRIADVTPLELGDAIERVDVNVIVAMALMGLRRSGRFPRVDEDVILDAPTSRFELDLTDGVEEGAEPDPLPRSDPDDITRRSGSPGRNGSEPTAPSLEPTGPLSSDTPASDPSTSTT